MPDAPTKILPRWTCTVTCICKFAEKPIVVAVSANTPGVAGSRGFRLALKKRRELGRRDRISEFVIRLKKLTPAQLFERPTQEA